MSLASKINTSLKKTMREFAKQSTIKRELMRQNTTNCKSFDVYLDGTTNTQQVIDICNAQGATVLSYEDNPDVLCVLDVEELFVLNIPGVEKVVEIALA